MKKTLQAFILVMTITVSAAITSAPTVQTASDILNKIDRSTVQYIVASNSPRTTPSNSLNQSPMPSSPVPVPSSVASSSRTTPSNNLNQSPVPYAIYDGKPCYLNRYYRPTKK